MEWWNTVAPAGGEGRGVVAAPRGQSLGAPLSVRRRSDTPHTFATPAESPIRTAADCRSVSTPTEGRVVGGGVPDAPRRAARLATPPAPPETGVRSGRRSSCGSVGGRAELEDLFASVSVALSAAGLGEQVDELQRSLSANLAWTAELEERLMQQRATDGQHAAAEHERAVVAEAQLAAAERELRATEAWASELEEMAVHAMSSPTRPSGGGSMSAVSRALAAKRRADPRRPAAAKKEERGAPAALPERVHQQRIERFKELRTKQLEERERMAEEKRKREEEERKEHSFDPFKGRRKAGHIPGGEPKKEGGCLKLRGQMRQRRRAQLALEGEEQRRQREEREIVQCTFSPAITKYVPPSPAPRFSAGADRAEEEFVQRMQRAQAERDRQSADRARDGEWAAEGGWKRGSRYGPSPEHPRWEGWAGEWVGGWRGGPALCADVTQRKMSMSAASALNTTQCTWASRKQQRHKTADRSPTRRSKQPPYRGWVPVADAASGQTYYAHTETREVTWECPPELLEHTQKDLRSSGEDAGAAVQWWAPPEGGVPPAAAHRYADSSSGTAGWESVAAGAMPAQQLQQPAGAAPLARRRKMR